MRREGTIWAIYFLCWLFLAALMGASRAHAQGSIQQSGPATPLDALCFVQNGIAKDCGFPPAPAVGTCALRVVATGTSDLPTTGDCSIAWNSATASPKTEFLFACTLATKGAILTIVDDVGTAGTYPITITPSGINTVLGATSFIIAFNRQSATIICDGIGNWVGT